MARPTIKGQPLRLTPALETIYRDPAETIVIQKSAQVGITEMLVSLALFYADRGLVVLYVMPYQNVADDLVSARVDPAIDDSRYLRGRLRTQARKGADRKRLKRIGDGYVYFRGADNPKQISGVDADVVILDEYDQMAADILPMARKRQAASRQPRLYVASTPTQPEWGINALFLKSDQQRCWLPCPACGLAQRLDWEHNVNAEGATLVCRQCRTPLDVYRAGAWQAERPGNRLRGYHLPRLLSPRCNLARMLEDSDAVTVAEAIHFQTQDLGEAYRPEGGSLSYGDLDACRSEASLRGPVFMGVDVGKYLHVVVRQYEEHQYGLLRARPSQLLYADLLPAWDRLPEIMHEYGVERCVIDAAPELHKARELAGDCSVEVALAEFKHGQATIQAVEDEWGVETLYIDRTLALDVLLQGFLERLHLLPPTAREIGGRVKHGLGEYYREMVAPQRVFDEEREEYRYPKGHDDHFAFAEVYCLMAATETKGGIAV